MAIVNLPNIGGGSDPATINVSVLNGKVDPLATDYNGNIQNVNIAAGAGIVYSKLTLTDSVVNADINSAAAIVDTKLATISTTGKVNTSALTTTSQAAGDVLYNNGTNWVRLAKDEGKYLLSGASAVSWGAIAVATAASQAEMETATSTTVAVTPGRAQYHPGVAKAWCMFNGATTGSNAPTVGYNVDSVERISTGEYVITFGTDFSSANYVMSGSALGGAGSAADFVIIKNGTTPGAGSVTIQVGYGSFTLDDSTRVSLMFFGDQ